MVQGSICICENDGAYSKFILEALQDTLGKKANILLLKDIEKVKEFFRDKKIQLLLIQEILYEELKEWETLMEDQMAILILTESRKCCSEEDRFVFKYQKCGDIVEKIRRCYEATLDERGRLLSKVTLVGVFSTTSNVFTTYYAELLSDYLVQQKKTLYLDLQLFSGGDMTDNAAYNMSDFIYQLNTRTLGEESRISLICTKRGTLDCFLPVKHCKDLFSLTGEDFTYFFEWLYEHEQYEVICIGFDFIHTFTEELLERCDYLFMPVGRSVIAGRKQETFLSMLAMGGKKDAINRIVSWHTDEEHISQPEDQRQQEMRKIAAQLPMEYMGW